MSPAGAPQTLQEHSLEHATCLGCGCTCDDITVRLSAGRIAETINTCALGREWFGDGTIPAGLRVDNADATLDAAIDTIVALLRAARAPVVYLAPELSCEAQREAIALADRLRACIDTITGDTALPSIIAAQERGRAGATLGEIRNRCDVLVFWGVDPDVRYPRYRTRYAPEPVGLHLPNGRGDRLVIAVDVGTDTGPADADVRVSVAADLEVAVLTAVTAMVRKPGVTFDEPLGTPAGALASHLSRARYSTIVADAEGPADHRPARDPLRAAALIALTQALNGPSRAALSTLRGGGNRPGADAVLTSQTGFPTGVDFSRGVPAYHPFQPHHSGDVTLIIGDASRIPNTAMERLTTSSVAIIGPRATTHPQARITIDTGVAGIHCAGTAIRMDDVPLPLRPSVQGHRDPAALVRTLVERVR